MGSSPSKSPWSLQHRAKSHGPFIADYDYDQDSLSQASSLKARHTEEQIEQEAKFSVVREDPKEIWYRERSSLKKNIQQLTEHGDTEEALSLMEKHPELQDSFHHAAKTMLEIRERPLGSMVTLKSFHGPPPLYDLLALLGAAQATVDIFNKQLGVVGEENTTDDFFEKLNHGDGYTKAPVLITLALCFWWDATDGSFTFCARLAKTNIYSWIVDSIKKTESVSDKSYSISKPCLNILHNSVKTRQLHQLFQDLKLKDFLIPLLKTPHEGTRFVVLFTLSHITDEEENHLLLADGWDFELILRTLSEALASREHEHEGFHVFELLQGLANLVQNDDNKELLMAKGALGHLKPILEEGWSNEKEEAARIIWALAFVPKNKVIMMEDLEFMAQLEHLQNDSNAKVAKACRGALWVLNINEKLKAPTEEQHSHAQPDVKEETGGHLMISYNWDNQKTMIQISKDLKQAGFKVWMDVENMYGSTLDAMAAAVEGASAVLVCMSQRYKDSPNCRTEADYAFKLQKPIVPLLMERGYKADGWLGILVGSRLFFDFSGKYQYEKKLGDLLKELVAHKIAKRNAIEGPIVAKKSQPVKSEPTVDVSSWSQTDVTDWINKHHLDGCPKLQNLSAKNIRFLQTLRRDAPEFFFHCLKRNLKLSSLDDLMNFCHAIDSLP